MFQRIQGPLLAFSGCVIVFILDLVSKHFFFDQGYPFSFMNGWVRSISHQNYGIAFNIPIPQSVILGLTFLASIGILAAITRAPQKRPRLFSFFLGVLLGGASGNAFDRWQLGFVRDWLLLWHRSAINLADIGVLVGLSGALLLHSHTSQKDLS